MFGETVFSARFIRTFTDELAGLTKTVTNIGGDEVTTATGKVGNGDDPLCRWAYGIENALREVSQASDSIQTNARRMRQQLAKLDKKLAGNGTIYESDVTGPTASDIDGAIERRRRAWEQLVAALPEKELERVRKAASGLSALAY